MEPAVLVRQLAPISAEKNSPFTFTSIVQTPGYPDPPLYQWFHDGVLINTSTSTNPNVSVYPNIVFRHIIAWCSVYFHSCYCVLHQEDELAALVYYMYYILHEHHVSAVKERLSVQTSANMQYEAVDPHNKH